MSPPLCHLEGDLLQARRCQQGDVAALAALRHQLHDALLRILLSRGASRSETEDLLADLWSDCVPGDGGRSSLLEKFSGKCALLSWLATVATRRWIDLKRKQARYVEFGKADIEHLEAEPLNRLPAEPAVGTEDVLLNILLEGLRAAFSLCPPESMVLLRLRYVHGVSQREIVRMLGCHESKVSRVLSQALQDIETNALREVKRHDPWLDLTWQDFLDLCEARQIGFL
jgi:RNA polymerase sigma factor (sigma-70 family)